MCVCGVCGCVYVRQNGRKTEGRQTGELHIGDVAVVKRYNKSRDTCEVKFYGRNASCLYIEIDMKLERAAASSASAESKIRTVRNSRLLRASQELY